MILIASGSFAMIASVPTDRCCDPSAEVGSIATLGQVVLARGVILGPVVDFILGLVVEENSNRAMLICRGEGARIMERPISGTLLGMTAALLLWTA